MGCIKKMMHLVDAGKAPLYDAQKLEELGEGTDWQDEAFTNSLLFKVIIYPYLEEMRDHGSHFQGIILNREGILRNTGFDEYSFRVNFDHEFDDKFKFGAFITGASTNAKWRLMR